MTKDEAAKLLAEFVKSSLDEYGYSGVGVIKDFQCELQQAVKEILSEATELGDE